MAVCESCQLDNPPDRHFCQECGGYLRWLPTGEMPVARTSGLQPIRLREVRQAAARGSVAPPPETAPATVIVAAAGADAGAADAVVVSCAPGGQVALRATIRNRSRLVERFQVRVGDLPDGWWTATPATVHLVPFGTAGQAEQEVEIRVHPPRAPVAEARAWDFHVAAVSVARPASSGRSQTLTLIVEPYAEHDAVLRPERTSGRRRGRFALTVRNNGNAPAAFALAGSDAEEQCRFRFDPPQLALRPGEAGTARLTVRPPRQILIGRPRERALRVAPAPDATVLPATFRQRPWLPQWLLVAIPLSIVAGVALWTWLPRFTVPDLREARTRLEAQRVLQRAHLKIDARPQLRVTDAVPPGTVIDQIPDAGSHVRSGTPVTIVLAVGSHRHAVPDVIGMTLPEADAALAGRFKLGAWTPQSAEPSARIVSQWPAAGAMRNDGTPVNVALGAAAPSPTPTPTPSPPPLATDDGRDLYVTAGGRPAERVSTDGAATEPAWDPSGRTLAYMHLTGGRGRIWSFSLDGRYPGRPLSDAAGDYHRPAFAPDGSAVAFIDKRAGRGDVCIVPASGSRAKTPCRHDPTWRLERLTWSPDSRALLFVAYARAGGRAGIVEYVAHGDPAALGSWRPVASDDGLVLRLRKPLHVAWAPDGATVALTAGEQDRPAQVYTVAAAGHRLERTGKELQYVTACHVSWYPDGRLALGGGACDGTPGDIVLLDLSTGKRTPAGQGADAAWPAKEAGSPVGEGSGAAPPAGEDRSP